MSIEDQKLHIEIAENGPENFVEKRASLLSRIIARGLEVRDNFGQKIVNADPEKWKRIKRIPLIRSIATTGEVILGAEPGKRFSTKEALTRAAVAALMALEDVFLITEGKTQGKDNLFKGKSMQALSHLKEKMSEKDPQRSNIISAVSDFLERNPDIVENAEDQVHSFLQANAA